jgi:hypothetical protein
MNRFGRSAVAASVVILLAVACGGGDEDEGAGVVAADDTPEIAGVTVVAVDSARHVGGTVDYSTDPPAGGDHDGVWQNCGFYTVEVRPEHVVHSLEHGAVWITYRPDADDAVVDAIAALAGTSDYILASPYPDNPGPIVLTAWGRQAPVESIDDPLVGEFLATYLQDGPTTPEPGAPCWGRNGAPPAQANTVVG